MPSRVCFFIFSLMGSQKYLHTCEPHSSFVVLKTVVNNSLKVHLFTFSMAFNQAFYQQSLLSCHGAIDVQTLHFSAHFKDLKAWERAGKWTLSRVPKVKNELSSSNFKQKRRSPKSAQSNGKFEHLQFADN